MLAGDQFHILGDSICEGEGPLGVDGGLKADEAIEQGEPVDCGAAGRYDAHSGVALRQILGESGVAVPDL